MHLVDSNIDTLRQTLEEVYPEQSFIVVAWPYHKSRHYRDRYAIFNPSKTAYFQVHPLGIAIFWNDKAAEPAFNP